jgi:hypothetical protein
MGDFVDLPTNRNGLHLQGQYRKQPRAEIAYEAWVPENGTSATVLRSVGILLFSVLSCGVLALGHGRLLLHKMSRAQPGILRSVLACYQQVEFA